MAVTLTGAGGLFTILGKIFHAQNTLDTARRTTVPPEVVDVITAWEGLTETLNLTAAIEGLPDAAESWQRDEVLMDELRDRAAELIVTMIHDDNPQPDQRLRTAIVELIKQMEGAGGETNPTNDVNASAASLTVTAGGSNVGDHKLRASVTNGDGRNVELALAEDIEVEVQSVDGNGTIRLRGEDRENSRLSYDWPQGSGISRSLAATSGLGSLLTNGGMDDEDDRPNTPDDWVVDVGTIGTTVKMTDYEVQTVEITATPTSGDYVLVYTSVDGDVQTTKPLDYNASGGTVQAALRALKGLENITVSSSGVSPLFTHTITFKGMDPPGNVGQLTSSNTFDAGGITHATTTTGSQHVYRDKALEFDSNGVELTSIKQDITAQVEPRGVYCFNAFMKVDVFPAGGVITVDLVDGAGTVIQNAQNVNQTFTIDPQSGGDLSTSAFTAVGGFFQLNETLPEIVYLRIRISTAISSGTSLFIDEVALVEAEELYTGGPFVAFFRGQTELSLDDTWTITVTNARGGGFQDAFYKNFGFADLLLPSDSAGGETILDSLIA
jgi:hypothetical protein